MAGPPGAGPPPYWLRMTARLMTDADVAAVERVLGSMQVTVPEGGVTRYIERFQPATRPTTPPVPA